MKKALLLLVITGMLSSVASAGLVQPMISSLNGDPIDPVSEITIKPSDTINFDIVSDTQLLTFNLIVELELQGPGTLDISQLTTPPGWDPGFHVDPREIEPGKIYEFGEGNFSGGPQPGIQLDHILMHCDGLGDVIITLRDGTQGGTAQLADFATPEFGSITIHQIPEPMTMGLLGLGGLGLLRRRRR